VRRLLKLLKWSVAGLVLLLIPLVAPIAYVELACTGESSGAPYQPLIIDPEFQRKEANSYLTYPEWHIVYAYEGLAEKLKTGDEHEFDYLSSIAGFWRASCALNKVANAHGGADQNTRQTNHVIGASFTLEMGMKALYEETLGRLFALFRGAEKSPQDVVSAQMADDYAKFLYQTPWYKYDFASARARLWDAPLTMPVRGWERRLALGGEWSAKMQYARAIAGAVSAAGVAKLEIRSIVSGVNAVALKAIPEVEIIREFDGKIEINTPRYAAFTEILKAIAAQGGSIIEIAGNDEIMITATAANDADVVNPDGSTLIAEVPRDGFDGRRLILSVPIAKLSETIRTLGSGPLKLEHIYDY
jgi:hypothetical protein